MDKFESQIVEYVADLEYKEPPHKVSQISLEGILVDYYVLVKTVDWGCD